MCAHREDVEKKKVVHCLVEEWKDCEEPKPKEKVGLRGSEKEETTHQSEWRAEANKYRCMRSSANSVGGFDGDGEI